jgi:leucyl-tRNA synthetase
MAEMMDRYIPANIEKKWQEKWEQDGLYHSDIEHS